MMLCADQVHVTVRPLAFPRKPLIGSAMIWKNVSELSTILVPADIVIGETESTNFGRRAARAILIVAVAAFWIWGLIR